MMVDGMWMTNVTCPRCRHRHPDRLAALEADVAAIKRKLGMDR